VKTNPILFAPAVLLLATTIAQEPGARPKGATTETELQSLQLLVTEVVHNRQATAAESTPKAGGAGTGSSLDKPFACIRDAEFAPDGRLVNLIVEAPPTATSQDTTQSLLPAKAVRWDAGTRRWLLVENNMKYAELQHRESPTASKKQPALDSEKLLLASDLLRATVAGGSAAPEKAVEATGRKIDAPSVVWWIEPTQRHLAFAVLTRGGKFTPVPWSVLRTSGSGESMQVRIEAPPTVIETAPTCATAGEPPSAALRHKAYEHYGTPPPTWDRKPEAVDKGKETDGKDSGKG
jgi:hypothetical protein